MRASQSYVNLVLQHAKLRQHLLPLIFDISGNYSEQTVTHTIAYRVLTHAEIESYLEERAFDTATAAMKEWQSRKKVSKTLLGLLAFSSGDIDSLPKPVDFDKLKQPSYSGNRELTNRIKHAMNVFGHFVEENNGIKENNVFQLLLPIGVEINQIETDLLADLNSYGELRGDVAHLSRVRYRMTKQIDPQTEASKAKSIIARLIKIDKAIDKLIIEISS